MLLDDVALRLAGGASVDGVTVPLIVLVETVATRGFVACLSGGFVVSSWMLAKNISKQRTGLLLLSRAATQIGLSRAESSLELALAVEGAETRARRQFHLSN
jgi:hypothetical protein